MGKITIDHINLLKSWKHSGFQVFCGPRIHPRKKEAMENLARYIIRASFPPMVLLFSLTLFFGYFILPIWNFIF